jgi:hypothetical protein
VSCRAFFATIAGILAIAVPGRNPHWRTAGLFKGGVVGLLTRRLRHA